MLRRFYFLSAIFIAVILISSSRPLLALTHGSGLNNNWQGQNVLDDNWVFNDVNLTIAAGSQVYAEEAHFIVFINGASLTIAGEEEDRVTVGAPDDGRSRLCWVFDQTLFNPEGQMPAMNIVCTYTTSCKYHQRVFLLLSACSQEAEK